MDLSVGQVKRIWINRSSIIKRVFYNAKLSTDKVHLGLGRQHFSIKCGMSWKNFKKKLLRLENPTEISILHCKENEIDKIPLLNPQRARANIVQLSKT